MAGQAKRFDTGSRPGSASAHCGCPVHQGFLVREPKRAAIAQRRSRSSRKSEFRSMSARPLLSETDIEVVIKLDGKAETASTDVVSIRIGIRRHISYSQCAARESQSARYDRMPASAVPVCARDHCERGPKRRVPATPARSRGFRQSLSAEDGSGAANAPAVGS